MIINRVETIDGSANEGEDYVAINETLTFEPYQKEKEVSTSEDDGDADNDEDVRDDNFLAMTGWQMLGDRRTGGPRKVRVFSERKDPQNTLLCRKT